MHAEVSLPLDKMTITEKLEVMETLWENISRKPDEFTSPEWHGECLRDIKKKVAAGEAKIFDFAEAKKVIRDATK